MRTERPERPVAEDEACVDAGATENGRPGGGGL